MKLCLNLQMTTLIKNHSCAHLPLGASTFQDAIARTHDPNPCHQSSDLWFTSCALFLSLSCLSSGVVRVSLADMDRETRENYSVVIQAKDMGGQLGGLAGTTTINITLSDINDNPPMFDQSKTRSLLTVLLICTTVHTNVNISVVSETSPVNIILLTGRRKGHFVKDWLSMKIRADLFCWLVGWFL